MKRAIKSRDIRRDLEPFDLLRALIGVSHVASGHDWQQSARRLVASSTAFWATSRALAASRRSEAMKSALPPGLESRLERADLVRHFHRLGGK